MAGSRKDADGAANREACAQAVEQALYRLAVGYESRNVKHFKRHVVEYDQETGKKVRDVEEAVPVEEVREMPPSVAAARAWMEYYRPDGLEGKAAEVVFVEAAKALLGKVMEEDG